MTLAPYHCTQKKCCTLIRSKVGVYSTITGAFVIWSGLRPHRPLAPYHSTTINLLPLFSEKSAITHIITGFMARSRVCHSGLQSPAVQPKISFLSRCSHTSVLTHIISTFTVRSSVRLLIRHLTSQTSGPATVSPIIDFQCRPGQNLVPNGVLSTFSLGAQWHTFQILTPIPY
jgi:hypothetical protein